MDLNRHMQQAPIKWCCCEQAESSLPDHGGNEYEAVYETKSIFLEGSF